MPKEPYVSDAPLDEPVRLCRRTVRKGCAFPTLRFFLLRLRLRWEAQPPVIFGELDGKAEPYRTVRWQSHTGSLSDTTSSRLTAQSGKLFHFSEPTLSDSPPN